MNKNAWFRRVLAMTVAFGNMLALAGAAHANQYGELHIRSNTTLTDNRYGDIVFDAGNITLDCAGHQVHISSYTRINDGQKLAIYANGMNRVTIKNCSIVGGFDASIELKNSMSSVVQNVSASTTYLFLSDSYANVSGLTASGNIGLNIDGDTGGIYSATVRCGSEGIHVYSSSETMLTNTSVTGCTGDGIVGQSNSDLMIYDSDVERNGFGFSSSDSNYDDIERKCVQQ
jgi:hypothetical protein